MRLSKYLLPTLREVPAEAEIPSHQLMLRAGLIRKLASGVYGYLPLGLKVLKNVEKIKFVNFTLEEKAILFLLEQLNFLTRNNVKTIEDIEFQSKYLLDKNINFEAASAGVEIINLIKLVQAIRSYESGLIEYGDILVKYVNEATYYNFEEKKEMSLATPSIEVFKEKAKEARAKAIQIYTVDGELMPPKPNYSLLLKERIRGR